MFTKHRRTDYDIDNVETAITNQNQHYRLESDQ
jgi:hypothetical protein